MPPCVDSVRHAVSLGFGDEPLLVQGLIIVVQPKLLGDETPLFFIAEFLLFSQYDTPSFNG